MDPELLEMPKSVRRSQLNWKLWLLTAAFEGVLIVLSVVLGLMLTGWAQDQRDRQRVADMSGFIRQEIAANRALIVSDETLPHHQRLRDALVAVGRDPAMTRADAMPAFNALTQTGVHPAATDDSVWRSIGSGDLIEHMAPETVFTLARVYRAQENLRLVNETIYGMMTRIPSDIMRGDPPAGSVMQLQLAMNDLVATEEALVKRYDEALKRLGGE